MSDESNRLREIATDPYFKIEHPIIAADITTMLDKLDAMRKDADRYRKLRAIRPSGIYFCAENPPDGWMDAMIDLLPLLLPPSGPLATTDEIMPGHAPERGD